jgi:hypothetical protein
VELCQWADADLKGMTLRKALVPPRPKVKLNIAAQDRAVAKMLPGSKLYPGATCIVEASL